MEEGIQQKHLRDLTDAAHGGVGGLRLGGTTRGLHSWRQVPSERRLLSDGSLAGGMFAGSKRDSEEDRTL